MVKGDKIMNLHLQITAKESCKICEMVLQIKAVTIVLEKGMSL